MTCINFGRLKGIPLYLLRKIKGNSGTGNVLAHKIFMLGSPAYPHPLRWKGLMTEPHKLVCEYVAMQYFELLYIVTVLN